MLRVAKLLNVSRSSYYKWINRPISKRDVEDKALKEKISDIFWSHKQRYGSERIASELKDLGFKCGVKKVNKLMKEQNLVAKAKRKFKRTTYSEHNYPVSANLLDRNFSINEPNKVWSSDLTYIKTSSGWLYLCIVMDLFSRKIIGWAMGENMKTEMFIKALKMAYLARKPKPGIIFHSDRGCQYASYEFRKVLSKYQMAQSMSRKGDCWDNAPVESFFHTLKVEEIYGNRRRNRETTINRIFEYIEIYYNRKRKHSYLNLITPYEYEAKYAQNSLGMRI